MGSDPVRSGRGGVRATVRRPDRSVNRHGLSATLGWCADAPPGRLLASAPSPAAPPARPEVSDASRRTSTSRPTRRSCTSSRILRDEKTEPKKFREVVRELSWLLGYEALADARVRPLKVATPLETMDGHELGERIGLIPILRAGLGHGRRDAGADADRRGLAPRPVPRRADAPAGRVLQQAARLGDGRPVPDPRPDARDRRLGDGRDRGPQALGRGDAGPDQARQPHRRARGRRGGHRRPTPTSRSTARRSTASSTTRATSCPASATPATASSGPARPTERGSRPARWAGLIIVPRMTDAARASCRPR